MLGSLILILFEPLRRGWLRKNLVIRFFTPSAMTLLFGLVLLLVSQEEWQLFAVWCLAAVLLLAIQLIVLWTTTERASFRKRLARMPSESDHAFGRFIAERFGYSWQVFFFCLFLLIIGAYAVGIGEAKRQRDFYVIGSEPPLVILRIYGDRAICAPFDALKHQIDNSFSLRDMSASLGFPLKRQRVGPLSVKE